MSQNATIVQVLNRAVNSILISPHSRTQGIFEDYVTMDDELPIGATEVQEIADLSESMNSDSDAEIDNETLIQTVNALSCLETEKISHAAGCKVEKKVPSSQESKRFSNIVFLVIE
ncbi:hypothetical protein TNCV_2772991 [Trichonephila clavipes]|nr:hypothetical protein TNCV_2772991 [Trichonephila clavipes]